MNEERLKRILETEAQAQDSYNKAVLEARALPEQAEQAVKAKLEETKRQAEIEAAQIIDGVKDSMEIEQIINQYAERVQQREILAQANMSKAVNCVLQVLLGNLKPE